MVARYEAMEEHLQILNLAWHAAGGWDVRRDFRCATFCLAGLPGPVRFFLGDDYFDAPGTRLRYTKPPQHLASRRLGGSIGKQCDSLPGLYFEREDDQFLPEQRGFYGSCHAINNVLGSKFLAAQCMRDACKSFVVESPRPWLEKHSYINGWYSPEVMNHAMTKISGHDTNSGTSLVIVPATKGAEETQFQSALGAVFTVGGRTSHWVSLKKYQGKIFLLDSTVAKPRQLSRRDFSSLLTKCGASLYLVQTASESQM